MPYSKGVESLEIVWLMIENRLPEAKALANKFAGGYFPNFEQAVANANLQNTMGLRNTLLDILAADVVAMKE